MTKKIVYIAGKFRGKNSWEIEQNVRLAETWAYYVWRYGGIAICPHTNTRFFDGSLPDEVWLEGDLEILKRCDAVFAVPNWRDSEGATKEIELAKKLGKPVFYNDGCGNYKLKAWLNNQPDWENLKFMN